MKVLQTWRLIKLYSADSPTGFEVRSVKSMGSEVAHKTDLHLTHQLEMIISRCITVSFFFFFLSKGWCHKPFAHWWAAFIHPELPLYTQEWAVYTHGSWYDWTGHGLDTQYACAILDKVNILNVSDVFCIFSIFILYSAPVTVKASGSSGESF